MSYRKLQHSGKVWHFQVFGRGAHGLIAFHGFGESSNAFANWEGSLGEQYTILAVDLPFHGKMGDWSGAEFRPEDILGVIRGLRAEFNFARFSLVGHSLGGRLLMCLLGALEFQPEGVWLIAPDGLATRRLGILGRLPAQLLRPLASSVNRYASFWVSLAAILYRLRAIDRFSMQYLSHHLYEPGRRKRLVGVWRSLLHFPVVPEVVLENVQQEDFPVHLVYGTNDKVIAWDRIEDFMKQWPAGHLHAVPGGHRISSRRIIRLLSDRV